MNTPKALGFRFPAEWETHRATWLCWPREDGISFEGGWEGIPELWAQLAHELSQGEEVHICLFSEAQREQAQSYLKGKKENIYWHDFPAYEPWPRDYGPTFLVGPAGKALIDWGFNAWGGKYPPWELDDLVPQKIAQYRRLPLWKGPVILEGGAIDTDGEGTLLASQDCLLDPRRNPGLTQREMEQILEEFLGVKRVIWLSGSLEGDDTDGHVDNLARFVAPGVVVVSLPEDPQDANYPVCWENYQRLAKSETARGQKLCVVPVPLPDAVVHGHQRLPASYVNFYIANHCVIVPSFGWEAKERQIQEVLSGFFPGRRILLWEARRLIWGLGAFHCITLQEPL
ncbi:agmatine deiminase family protein [Candidatus Methylacidithermus pantelleriae]|uniref:N-carbamoylputrescine amidase / Agmatine deiminase n=1 Tax=Candidatus Methylacidithermus pantelleriae TaxID=2744239 RepID=A0A8J2BNI5_9BACT|nr:agmatine deiminase family protein [Candidatus Methylacidithermus pantelleriae]CAF0693976.1 N-carbamoylputrescine amidase / Agmatine deiminase [Candidatus Methylacidithermus pantelleriae]